MLNPLSIKQECFRNQTRFQAGLVNQIKCQAISDNSIILQLIDTLLDQISLIKWVSDIVGKF